jgi:hypothetical protein
MGMTHKQLLGSTYRHFRKDKQLPVDLYVQLKAAVINPDKALPS